MSYTFRIKEILNDKKMLQKDLAALLEITPVTLSQNLSRNPSIQTLAKIADALNVDVLDLFEDNRPAPPSLQECPHCHNKLEITIK